MSAYISSLDYVLNNVIGSKKLTNFNAYDTHTNNRRLIGECEGNNVQAAQREFTDLYNALMPGEKMYCIFSEKTREQKSNGGVKDQTFYFVKADANQGQAIGAQAQPQGINREDLINDRWAMELKYRDEIRDLKDELRRTKEAQEPKWYEALLANQLNKPNGAGELAALAGHFIGMVKGNPQGAAIVNGTDTQPAHINTEVEGRVNAAITSLFQFDKEFLEVLEGLQRFTAKPENASTYNIIKQQLLNS